MLVSLAGGGSQSLFVHGGLSLVSIDARATLARYGMQRLREIGVLKGLTMATCIPTHQLHTPGDPRKCFLCERAEKYIHGGNSCILRRSVAFSFVGQV